MCRNLTILISLLLILLVPGESKSTLIRTFLRFAVDHPNDESVQIPPSPSPSPSIGLDSRGGGDLENSGGEKGESDEHDQVPSNLPEAGLVVSITDEKCNLSLSMLCRDLKNMIACLSNGGTGPEGSFVIVENNEDTTVKVNFTIFPSNSTFEKIELQKHQAKKINISELIDGSQSIVLDAGNGNCTIHIASSAPEVNSGKNNEWVGTNVKPTHGAYILVLMVLIGGGVCACFKFRKRGRHLDGVPYQELEMGQPEPISVVNVETEGGWDEDWDDDWDEEKAVKSPGGKSLRHGKVNGNGVASRSSHDNGRGNDWDD